MSFLTASFFVFLALASLTYYRIATDAINYITGVLFVLAIGAFVWAVAEVSMTAFRLGRSVRPRIRLLVATATIAVLLLEVSFRGIGRYANYYEQNGRANYVSLYALDSTSRYRLYTPNTDIGWTLAEYSHHRKVNSLGLSERPLEEAKAPAEYRIIALGDSFTEGVGTAYESSWVKVMEKDLAGHYPKLTVSTINAGISGSDPYFEYVLLRDRLLSYNPDLVIVSINNSDITDITIRGGAERFQANGQIEARRRGPKWEWAYGASYIVRHVVQGPLGYNWLLLSPKDAIAEEQTAVDKIKQCVTDFVDLARERHFEILFAFSAHQYEIKAGRYFGLFQNLVTDETHSPNGDRVIDLLDYYRANKIITPANSQEFYWTIDLHHNTKGYEAMGNAIAQKVMDSHFIDKANLPADH